MLCEKCAGRKQLYKNGAGYNTISTGGKLVDCPECYGTGKAFNDADKDAIAKAGAETATSKLKKSGGGQKRRQMGHNKQKGV